ncbi:hypothetical protein JOC95_003994 [Bacillus tianshenii]|uniref:DUF7852 domain-containing protein n=1 Tax=Sutcliffiella tianshenii TaxID=1463404 RepID=A0ABS2P5C5_9BACI|nr:DUF3794 domain-containing protein [Bacillus tianshenii]MBM7622084.1 hypothetical protein [Bacillus tianshenii]
MNKDKNCVEVDVSATIGQCESVDIDPQTTPGDSNNEVVMRVPVTIAERRVNTSLVANIKFPHPVLEIKDIKKSIQIVQCRLLLPGISPEAAAADGFFQNLDLKLFLKGFVRKNITYATPCPHSKGDSCISSEIKSLTAKIPFECVTTIPAGEFTSPPQLPLFNSRNEFDFFRAQDLGPGYPEKEKFLSSDISQFHQVSNQYYNNYTFCELLASNIIEWDEAIDRTPLSGNAPFQEGTFQEVVEKMFLTFDIKVLQHQQVRVAVIPPQ